MGDEVLEQYRRAAAERTGLTFPRFADEAVNSAPILAVLQNPGNSGAEVSGVCSLDNADPTARRTARIIASLGLNRDQIIFWNFYGAYEATKPDRSLWATELEHLISLLPNLRAVIAFGDQAWRGMRDVQIPRHTLLVGAPHPSNRSCNSNPDAEDLIVRAWRRAKAILD